MYPRLDHEGLILTRDEAELAVALDEAAEYTAATTRITGNTLLNGHRPLHRLHIEVTDETEVVMLTAKQTSDLWTLAFWAAKLHEEGYRQGIREYEIIRRNPEQVDNVTEQLALRALILAVEGERWRVASWFADTVAANQAESQEFMQATEISLET